MTHSRTAVLPLRSPVVALSPVLFLVPGLAPAPAQPVESVVGDVRADCEQQFETADAYVVKTRLYASYDRGASGAGHSPRR